MNKIVSRALYCALFVGGLTLLGATAANAADTGGADGVASGSQVVSGIVAPVTAGGNAISLVGDSTSASAPAASQQPVASIPADSATSGSSTSGTNGIASGTQVVPDVTAPVEANGNAVSASSGTRPLAPRPRLAVWVVALPALAVRPVRRRPARMAQRRGPRWFRMLQLRSRRMAMR
jgi:hypothetical protein